MIETEPVPYQDPGGRNFLFCVDDLVDVVMREAPDTPPYYLLGGGVSAALSEQGTHIDIATGSICPPRNLYKPQFRDNGSQADCDILLASSSQEAADQLRKALTPNPTKLTQGSDEERKLERAKPGCDLKIGVSPLTTEEEYESGSRLTADFVSKRVEANDGKRTFRILDLVVELPDEYFDQWQQVLPSGKTIPTMHPVILMANYASRVCHGIRHRDVAKLQKMHQSVGHYFDTEIEWDQRQRRADIRVNRATMSHTGVEAALEFLSKKNTLMYAKNRSRMGRLGAGIYAVKQTLHRPADRYLEKLGQGGPLFDHVLSKISGERQTRLEQ